MGSCLSRGTAQVLAFSADPEEIAKKEAAVREIVARPLRHEKGTEEDVNNFCTALEEYFQNLMPEAPNPFIKEMFLTCARENKYWGCFSTMTEFSKYSEEDFFTTANFSPEEKIEISNCFEGCPADHGLTDILREKAQILNGTFVANPVAARFSGAPQTER